MVFSGLTFLSYFLPALFLCYFIVPQKFRQTRNFILLVFSLAFYGASGLKYLALMAFSITLNYLGGLFCAGKRFRKGFLFLTVAANLGLLVLFKYLGFFAQIVNSAGLLIPVPEITLPIGISFYTFQGISYVVDVYRGTARPQRNPLKLGLYISMFPQLVAGPIVRYDVIAKEIDSKRESVEEVSAGLVRFCFGLGKKVLIANTMGKIADAAFAADPSVLTCPAAWLGALAYMLQIYFDFSAYSDMAIGLGRVFGFHFPENFNYPYISGSVTEFWRRWHISLSSWFRDYVYIPLGGSRVKPLRHIANILIVWLLTGFWHGAAWNFIFWGGWYALWLLGEKYIWPGLIKKVPKLPRILATMLIVLVGWVFFRAENIGSALIYLKTMFFFGPAGDAGQGWYYLIEYWPEWLCAVIGCLPVKGLLDRKIPDGWGKTVFVYAFALLLLVVSYGVLTTSSFNPFLYFRF